MAESSKQHPYTAIPTFDHEDHSRLQTNANYQSNISPNDAPPYVVAAFFLLGVGVVLPWNALLSGIDFYSVLFPDISIAQFITNAYTFPFMIIGILFAVYPNLSQKRRGIIFLGFFLLAHLSAAIPFLAARDHPFETTKSAVCSSQLLLTIFISALTGATSAALQSLLFGMVALCPGGTCTTAFTAGGGFSSVVIVVLRILFRLFLDGDSQSLESLYPSFKVFFFSCAVVCFLCTIVFFILDQYSHFYAIHVKQSRPTESQSAEQIIRSAKSTLQDISIPAVCVLFSFAITLALFPGIVVKIPILLRVSASSAMQTWYPLVVVFLFAVGDTIGRILPTEEVTNNLNLLMIFTIARAALAPLYIQLWISSLPVSWLVAFLIVLVLGIGNGLVVTWGFLSIPLVTSAERRETAGQLMFVMLISGMFAGSFFSWVVELCMKHVNDNF